MRKKLPLISGILNVLEKLKGNTGIIENTSVATHTIAAGKYVIWKNDLYKASSAISIGDTLSLSNLTAVSDGIANELNSKLSYLDNVVTGTPVDISSYTSVANCYVCPSDGYARIAVNGHWLKIVNYENSVEWLLELSSSNATSVYCKKGTKLVANGSSAKFFPLVSA